MAEGNGNGTTRLVFAPGATEPFLHRLRSELQKGSVATVTIQMDQVSYVDPGALEILLAAGEEARAAEKPIFLEGVRTTVYKALQLAKLTGLFRRVHHG